MRDLDLKSLRLLVAVCDHQNIKQSAAQDTSNLRRITKRMPQLEETVGAPLVLRGSPRGADAGGHRAAGARAHHAVHGRRIDPTSRLQGGVKATCDGRQHLGDRVPLDDVATSGADRPTGTSRSTSRNVSRATSCSWCARALPRWRLLGQCRLRRARTPALPQRRLALAVPGGHHLAGRKSIAFAQTLDHEHSPATGLRPSRNARASGGAQRAHGEYRVIVSSFDAAYRVVAARLGCGHPAPVERSYASAGPGTTGAAV